MNIGNLDVYGVIYKIRNIQCIRDAIEKYNCNGIWSCLKGKTKTSGKHPQTGEKLMWKYY